MPTPTCPPPRMVKSSAPVELATVKSLVSGLEAVEVETASCENGVVVPIPRAEVVAEVPPATACVHASYEESLLLKMVQSAEARHPKTEALAVSQVTAPPAYVRPVEKVVVATPVHAPPTRARTWPSVAAKSEEVPTAVGTAFPPVALAMTVLAA